MRKTPFSQVLIIYGAVLFLLLLLWPTSSHPLARSAQGVLKSLRLAMQLEYAYADTLDDRHSDLPIREHETIHKSFSLTGVAHPALGIDNVFGSIEVEGGSSDQVEVVIEKTVRAETKDKLERARKEVTLDITQPDGSPMLYVNGPFRCECQDCLRSHGDDGYMVQMDFKVQVPRNIDTIVKTVNEGRVVVRNVNGKFTVRNVNGEIEMANIAGSGTAHTVNGPVKVTFRQNPSENSDFESVNGNVDLYFARDLSADFRFKTFNGGVYSDFPVTALPMSSIHEEHKGHKVTFHADRYTGVRVSSGGPEIRIENLNGDIRILENHE